MPKLDRRTLIVDTETTGLDFDLHCPVEVAWHNRATGENGCFIPIHTAEDLKRAQPRALEINGYYDRIAGRPQDTSGGEARRLAGQLHGNTLAGSAPAFDANMLRGMFKRLAVQGLCAVPTWHHRFDDLSCAAKYVLGLKELPGLDKVCQMLHLGVYPDHTAMGDVKVTLAAFQKLEAIRARFVVAA